jgi:hypothetical protein
MALSKKQTRLIYTNLFKGVGRYLVRQANGTVSVISLPSIGTVVPTRQGDGTIIVAAQSGPYRWTKDNKTTWNYVAGGSAAYTLPSVGTSDTVIFQAMSVDASILGDTSAATGPYAAPAGYRWAYVVSSNQNVNSSNNSVVVLERAA